MMNLIITRHGETLENQNKIMAGQIDGTLSKEGIIQAKKLGKFLKDRRIDLILSSDLKRTVDTAKEIYRYHKDAEFVLDKRLRERSFGELQGKPYPADWNWERLPSCVETNEELYARAKDVLDEILRKYKKDKDKTIVLACHGGMKMALLCVISRRGIEHFNDFKGMKNASISEYEFDGRLKAKEICVNSVKHLE